MKKLLLGFLLLTGCILFCYALLPACKIYDTLSFVERELLGLKRHSVSIRGEQLVYLSGGYGERTAVLIHGFGGSKENWNGIYKLMKSNYKVYAIDLPGFGESKHLKESYGIGSYSEIVSDFVKSLGKKNILLVGHSTGGLISAHVASDLPNLVSDLWLIAPLGASSADESDMTRLLQRGENILLPKSFENFDLLLDHLFELRPFIPGKVLEYLFERSVSSYGFLEKTFEATHQYKDGKINVSPSLNEVLKKYPGSIYLSWGMKDRILSANSGIRLKYEIPRIQLQVYDELGHMLLMEKPELPVNL